MSVINIELNKGAYIFLCAISLFYFPLQHTLFAIVLKQLDIMVECFVCRLIYIRTIALLRFMQM